MKKLDAQKIIEHLNNKWINKNCMVCGNNKWTVSDKIYELREYQDGNIVVGGSNIVPVVPIVCSNCGNTIFINPLIADAVSEQEE